MYRNQNGFTLIELMVVVIIVGLLATMAFSNWLSMQASAKEASVKANCHTVQLAAEDFAVRNDGIYSAGPDVLPGVGTLVALLPSGNLLVNPFSKVASEPQLGAAAAQQGETGYQGIAQNGVTVGYLIDGLGRDPATGPLLLLSSGQ